jgi:hypothetical protein
MDFLAIRAEYPDFSSEIGNREKVLDSLAEDAVPSELLSGSIPREYSTLGNPAPATSSAQTMF